MLSKQLEQIYTSLYAVYHPVLNCVAGASLAVQITFMHYMGYLHKRFSGAIVLCADCDPITLEPVSLWCRYTNARWEPEQEEMVQFRQRESVAIEDNNASITSQQEGEEFVVIS